MKMFQPEEYEYLLHEIKNYVCLISGSLQLINKQHPEIQEYRRWNEVLSDVDHLSQMCRDISASQLYHKITPMLINPTEFFLSLQNEITGLLHSNICFSLQVSPNLPEINMDPVQMKHALINLIKNASEAIADTDSGHITLSAWAKEEQLYIRIQDDGNGMRPDQLDKIFLPAYTTKASGSGIGLSITKKILEAHGGSISCRSCCGEGTSFILQLPLQEDCPA